MLARFLFYKSIRFRLIIWYTLAITITLVAFSVLLYREMSAMLHENLDTVLRSRAYGVVSSINTFWESEKLQAENEGSRIMIFSKLNDLNFIRIAQRWVKEQTSNPEMLDTVVQIFDSAGEDIAVPPGIPSRKLFTREICRSVLAGKPRFDVAVIPIGGKKVPLRLYTTPVFEGSMVIYVVQVASPLNLVDSALDNLWYLLTLLVPLTVLSTALIGVFLARIALQPVDAMIRSIRQITAENMRQRIHEPHTRDEVQRLAETFNDLLDRLEKAFVSQRQLLEDISHELKTPLTILKGELGVTLKKIRTAKEYETILCSSLEEIERMSRLIESLLLLSKIETHAPPPQAPLDLDELLRNTISDIRMLSEQKKIQFSFSGPGPVRINGVETQIRQLFLNLMDNAIKYTPEGGRVNVALEKDGEWARVSVADTGVGIPEQELQKVFERFYQVDKSRHSRGFGLGLSIVSSIVQAHRGRVDVKSTVGAGTVFTISLPTAAF